ncbi:MAG: hypothetical protein ACKOBP_09930, partial [Planctomycetia bacterium]
MDSFPVTSFLLAQADAVAAATGTAAAAAAPAAALPPVWREGWFLWLLTLAVIGVPTFVAWLLAKQFRASDMWARIAAVLVSLTAGIAITALGWPPRLGIDLNGGVILVYEVDAAKQAQKAVEGAEGAAAID